jgi:hypothetical protein
LRSQNKALSGNAPDQILTLQGVGWFKRKAISSGTVTLYIKHYKQDDGVECIDIDQTLTGGISGTREERVLDWEERAKEDHLFGAIVGKSRRLKAEEIENDFLRTGWTEETLEHGLVESYVISDTAKSRTSWIGQQVRVLLSCDIGPRPTIIV